jgi:threonine dehydrogenase-like Zn-dependent dehydrogenase
MGLAAHCGKVLVIGDYGAARADFRWNRVLHAELEIIGSNASAGAWDEAVAIAAAGELALEKLVTARLPVREFAQAIALARDSRTQVKVVLVW